MFEKTSNFGAKCLKGMMWSVDLKLINMVYLKSNIDMNVLWTSRILWKKYLCNDRTFSWS